VQFCSTYVTYDSLTYATTDKGIDVHDGKYQFIRPSGVACRSDALSSPTLPLNHIMWHIHP